MMRFFFQAMIDDRETRRRRLSFKATCSSTDEIVDLLHHGGGPTSREASEMKSMGKPSEKLAASRAANSGSVGRLGISACRARTVSPA